MVKCTDCKKCFKKAIYGDEDKPLCLKCYEAKLSAECESEGTTEPETESEAAEIAAVVASFYSKKEPKAEKSSCEYCGKNVSKKHYETCFRLYTPVRTLMKEGNTRLEAWSITLKRNVDHYAKIRKGDSFEVTKSELESVWDATITLKNGPKSLYTKHHKAPVGKVELVTFNEVKKSTGGVVLTEEQAAYFKELEKADNGKIREKMVRDQVEAEIRERSKTMCTNW